MKKSSILRRNLHVWLLTALLSSCLVSGEEASTRGELSATATATASTASALSHVASPEMFSDYSWLTATQQQDQSARDLRLEDGSLCEIPIPFDPDRGHRQVYIIGVLAIRGFEAAFNEFNATFNTYLSESAGKRFDPPIRFELKPLNFLTLFSDVEQGMVDYIYVNPSAYSCIESEYDAHSLVSQVSRRRISGNTYDLKKFGGVICARADREDINSITDLKDKVVAAASISGLGSGQMQFKEMIDNGMNYLQDPKQLVFTSNQANIVQGVYSGDFDVGFIRTDQLERSKDADGNPFNLTDFKIIDPRGGLNIDGTPFPFQSSTELYAEWNIAALTHVSPDVSREVQRAMLNVQNYAKVGEALQTCYQAEGEDICNAKDLAQIYDDPVKCSATHSIVNKAVDAQSNGKYAGWTTSLSYMQLRSMQEATGFISMDPETKTWRCIRPAEIYDAVSCPDGFDKKSKESVEFGCQEVGLECQEGHQCLCRPCEAPYELVCVDKIPMGDRCVSLAIFLPCVIIPVLLFVGILVHYYVEHKRNQSDSVWIVKTSELELENPPTIIGRGTFGLVLLAEYRGTRVAVKRVIPPSTSSTNSLFDTSHTTSNKSASSALNDMDMELGTHSMHPGMQSVAPSKLKTHLEESKMNLKDDRRKLKQQGGLKNIMAMINCFNRDDDTQARLKTDFVQEIRQLARLRHPCITTVMGAVMPTRRDEPMLVMEYMSHGSLHDVLQDDSIVLRSEQILHILQDVAQGLRFLHSASPQVVHGDLKAQNVLIDTNLCAKVTDFGLSGKRQIGAAGTPYWMSPELLTGEAVNSSASDIYAYGMVVYEIYSSRAPYDGERYGEVVRQVCDPRIKKRPPIPLHCPAKLAKLMVDCFLHDAIERPTAEQLDLTLKVELKVKERTSRLEALNRELEQANHKIASASAMQLQHFACMSHEIRTPLNCIIGLSSLLEETDLNPMQSESIEMIVSSGKLLRQIVDDVLDYSKLESGNAEVLINQINLQETLNAVIHLMKTSRVAVEKGLNIVCNYDPFLPGIISTDSRRIQQILYNLLGNAIKFSEEQGNVEFGVNIIDGRILSFTVKDSGKGIEECDYGKIFEPFRQTESGLNNASGGTGLGLAITKKLVEAMGGTISVESSFGSWTQFRAEFPFINHPVDIDQLSSKLKSTTVFFVADENDPNTKRVEDIFKQFNVDYVHFNSMQDLARVLATEGALSSEGTYICLSHEALVDTETYALLAANSRSTLVTFGPNFSIEKARKHWRSLVETFPSVLVHKLGVFAHEMTQDPINDDKLDRSGGRHAEFSKLRILIAEDNLINQKVLTRILNRLEVTSIDVANNGLEAVEMEAKKVYDLVLMDMQMPKMDGLQACQELHKRQGNHELAKVIFVTAHVSDSFRQTCLDNGAIGYLPKPCTVEGVSEVLQHTIGNGSLFSPMYKTSWNCQTVAPPFPDSSAISSATVSTATASTTVETRCSVPKGIE